jgi:hypothetical protein
MGFERFASALRALCERFALFFLKNIALCDRTPDIKPSNTREKKISFKARKAIYIMEKSYKSL